MGYEKNITQITQITQKKHRPSIKPLRERPLMKKSVMCVIRVMCVSQRVFIFFHKLATNSPHKSSQGKCPQHVCHDVMYVCGVRGHF